VSSSEDWYFSGTFHRHLIADHILLAEAMRGLREYIKDVAFDSTEAILYLLCYVVKCILRVQCHERPRHPCKQIVADEVVED
jgi:hypothetical protein